MVMERSLPMSNWIKAELAECQMHDARHTKRLARLLDRLSARPVSSIPTACHGWAETVAAYRFLDNSDIGVQEILSGHTHATLERIRTQGVVFQKWRWTEMHVTLGLIFVASLRKEWPMTFIAVRCPHCQSEQIVKRGK